MDKGIGTGLIRLMSRPKLADEVVEALRQSILSGQFAPSEHLVLETIAADLGVSVMPVREALITLSHEGLVQSMPRRGFRANPPTAADLDDIFELHAYLAGVLTGRAALSATPEDVARIAAVHDEIVRVAESPMAPDVARRLFDLNNEFHRLIHVTAEGAHLRRFLRSTTRLMRRDQYAADPSWVKTTLRDHPRIIKAIKAHDQAAAREITEAHIRRDALPVQPPG